MADAASPLERTNKRAPRQDAARNRERLLAAARSVFAEQGVEAPLEQIAKVAQVSRTTLYRHFPTREDLAATLFEDGIASIEAKAEQLRDVELGAVYLVDYVLTLQEQARAGGFMLSSSATPGFAMLAERTAAALRPVVQHAADKGILRSGLELIDVLLAIQMAETTLDDPDQDSRADHHGRARRLLLMGLFGVHAAKVVPGADVSSDSDRQAPQPSTSSATPSSTDRPPD